MATKWRYRRWKWRSIGASASRLLCEWQSNDDRGTQQVILGLFPLNIPLLVCLEGVVVIKWTAGYAMSWTMHWGPVDRRLFIRVSLHAFGWTRGCWSQFLCHRRVRERDITASTCSRFTAIGTSVNKYCETSCRIADMTEICHAEGGIHLHSDESLALVIYFNIIWAHLEGVWIISSETAYTFFSPNINFLHITVFLLNIENKCRY